MAESHKVFIIATFLIGIVNVVIIILAFATDSWVVVSSKFYSGDGVSSFRYGMFSGEITVELLASPLKFDLYMTCVLEHNACAVSCKEDREYRRREVEALAKRQGLIPSCTSTLDLDEDNPLPHSSVISAALYICLLVVLAIQLVFAVIATLLALVNVVTNPTETFMGLSGVLWSNAITSILGTIVLLMFGIYWAASTLQSHFAFVFTAVGELQPTSFAIGYSYWIMIVTILGSLGNVALIEVRRYLLEKDPPQPTIVVENHSQGTIFLY